MPMVAVPLTSDDLLKSQGDAAEWLMYTYD